MKNKIKGGLVVVGLIAPIVGTGIGPTCGYAFAQAVFATETQMRVSRHESVASISLAQHATNFAQASTALQGDSGSNDIALNLTLTNRTPMYIVTGGAAIPDTPAEYAAMQWNSTNSYMTVVNQLDWCGFIGAWGGCGHPEGMLQGFLLTRALVVSDKGGIALAHEFGHTLGNSHDNTGNMIMDPDLLTVNDTKCGTVTTCDKFRKYFPTVCNTGTGHSKPVICSPTVTTFAPQQPPALASVGAGILDDESDFSEVPIEELAKNIIVDQMPHQAEFFYGQDDVAVLRAMLEEADFAPTRRTIVTLIGLISDGSSEDVFAIQDHLSTEDAEVHASMFALGYIVNRTGDDSALQLLLTSFNGEDPELAHAAVLGLAASGDETALQALTERSAVERDPAAFERLQYFIGENKTIATLGVHGYYRQEPQPVPEPPKVPLTGHLEESP